MVANQLMPTSLNFRLKNHENVAHDLGMHMGENGLLLAFASDVWEVSSIRYVLWLQRNSFKLATRGINCAMIVPNQSYELNGFYMSIPRSITVPLLADPMKTVYDAVGMEQPGYMLFNRDSEIVSSWYVNDTAAMSFKSLLFYIN